jgi:hypothetical protein
VPRQPANQPTGGRPTARSTGDATAVSQHAVPGPPGDGDLLSAFRLLFGSGMALSIVLDVAAVRRREIAAHGAWVTRSDAIGLGAGTQVVTLGLDWPSPANRTNWAGPCSWPRAG